jgi:hypothetical protein
MQPHFPKENLMKNASRHRLVRVSSVRRCAALGTAALVLAGASPGVASAKAFVTPPAASKFAASFTVAKAGYFTANAAIDAAGTAHLAWQAPGSASLVSCRLPLGARKCTSLVTLPLMHSDNNAYGRTLVLQPAPGVVEVVANECCQAEPQLPITAWTSTDGGRSFGAPVSVGSLSGLDDAVYDAGQLVLLSEEPDGLHEQVTPADGSVPATSDSLISTDIGGVKVTGIGGGALLIAHETALFSATLKDTTSVDEQSGPAAAPSTVASFPGEDLISIASGGGSTYLMTQLISKTGDLDPPVRVRHWNGTGFDAPHTLPIPGTGDDSKYSLAVDGSGRLHAVWVGSRENYRLWHSVSTNGGRTWHAVLLGDAFNAAAVYPVLNANGTGIALELTAGTGPAVVQPLLITPALALTAHPTRVVAGGRTRLSGRVSPIVAGKVVLLQRLSGRHWVTVATVHESRSGAFTAVVTQANAGRTSYRAFVSGQYGTYDIGASSTVGVLAVRS